MTVGERLAELDITLPEVVAPLAAYVPAVRSGDVVYTAGQLPLTDGALPRIGRLGADVSVAEAVPLARQCALNALAAAASLVGLEQITRVLKVVGFVASAPGFTQQSAVVNGASEVLVDIFGEAGRHARSAVGVAELPLGAPVEVEMVVQVR